MLCQSFFDADGNFGILLFNVKSHLVLILFTLKKYIITISDCSFYDSKPYILLPFDNNFYNGQTLDITVNPW